MFPAKISQPFLRIRCLTPGYDGRRRRLPCQRLQYRRDSVLAGGFVPYEVGSYPAFVSGQRLGFLALVVDPAYDDFARLFVAGLAVELEQPQIIAVGSFLPGRRDEVCSELGEQLAERFEVLVPL